VAAQRSMPSRIMLRSARALAYCSPSSERAEIMRLACA
jgi:hypothetical protein